MHVRRSADSTPDLFSTATQPRADEPLACFKNKLVLHSQDAAPKHLLPKDLAGSLKRLEDHEIDTLLAAVAAEAGRRGRLPKHRTQTSPLDRRIAVEEQPHLTKGKLNAVRAAFRAGVKPSAIARQFGISQSDVKKALTQK
jgi:hypothetical protein